MGDVPLDLDGNRIDDPVVLTIVESIHQHVVGSVWSVVAALSGLAVMTIALLETGGDSNAWIPVAIVALTIAVIAEHRWLINRAGLVIARSRG